MSFNYPTLTIGPTTTTTIGNVDSVINNWYVRGVNIITGSIPYFSPLTVNIYHECHTATISATAINTINYTILSSTSTNTLTFFTVNSPSGLNCYTYSLLESDQVTPVTLLTFITFNYPTLTIGPTTTTSIGNVDSILFTWYVQATSIISGVIPTLVQLNVNIYHYCHTASITATAGDTINYTILSG